MRTEFTAQQLKDPDLAEANKILRTCVHCGFCTATCPTYVLLGDELDSPRGRIYLIKDMLENGKPATEKVVKHLDRCLSCLSCMSTCPSGVHYQHLIDHARAHVENTYDRPWHDKALRWLLSQLIPYPGRFRLALVGAWAARPLAQLPGLPARLKAMLSLAPDKIPAPSWVERPQVIPAQGKRTARVALLTGCAQRAIAPHLNEATVRLLTRHGVEVVIPRGLGCCGALVHHMGKEDASHKQTIANIRALMAEIEGDGLDAIISNASGCGTQLKDYGHMLRNDAHWAEPAETVAGLSRDITEFMETHGLGAVTRDVTHLTVAYHSACSLQHGQQIKAAPPALLRAAGYKVVEPVDPHLCCGSAGTYNLLQPEIADQLKSRKVDTLEQLRPDMIAAGNIGCITQIASGTELPIVHTAELLDWATGGPVPHGVQDR